MFWPTEQRASCMCACVCVWTQQVSGRRKSMLQDKSCLMFQVQWESEEREGSKNCRALLHLNAGTCMCGAPVDLCAAATAFLPFTPIS